MVCDTLVNTLIAPGRLIQRDLDDSRSRGGLGFGPEHSGALRLVGLHASTGLTSNPSLWLKRRGRTEARPILRPDRPMRLLVREEFGSNPDELCRGCDTSEGFGSDTRHERDRKESLTDGDSVR
jgi:hypothetical protein